MFLVFQYWREYIEYPILLNCAEYRGSVFVVAFGRIIYYLPTGFNWFLFSFLVLHLLLQIQLLAPLAIWAWLWLSLIAYIKMYHRRLVWFLRQRRDEYKIHLEDSALLYKKCLCLVMFICVCHDILSIISPTLLPTGWYFTGMKIMVRHPCTW